MNKPKTTTKIETKTIDLGAELTSAQSMFKKLAPQCGVAKEAAGIPQLAPQQKQMGILKHEMAETLLCINLASKGQHAVRDAATKSGIANAILQYENLEDQLRDERYQLNELDCLNYFAKKNVIDLIKTVPSEADELTMMEKAYHNLCRMEHRLDLAVKRLCTVNTDNKRLRAEINRLLIERNNFNKQWRRTINKLLRGKMYLMDIFEIASQTFAGRDEWSRKLKALKWKGFFELNKDISEMQIFDGELHHFANVEEFLRVKGTRRICEADEIEVARQLQEKAKCEEEIARHDEMLDEIFAYAGTDRIGAIMKQFKSDEVLNLSMYLLLNEVMQQSIVLKKDVDVLRQSTRDQVDINAGRYERQDKKLANLRLELNAQKQRNQYLRGLNNAADATIVKILKAVQEIVTISQCNTTPLMSLLGNHKQVTKWNVHKFLKILQLEVKSLIQVVYGSVKPPEPAVKSPADSGQSPKAGKHPAPIVKTLEPIAKPPEIGKSPLAAVAKPRSIARLAPNPELAQPTASVRPLGSGMKPLPPIVKSPAPMEQAAAIKPPMSVGKPPMAVKRPTSEAKPPTLGAKTTRHRRKAAAESTSKRIIAEPRAQILRPRSIETVVPYLPCAYCVEDYIMNMLFETPATPADKEFIDKMFHLQEVNTKFGIFTLTIPEKRHGFRDLHRD